LPSTPAITDLDFSAARSIRELLDDLARRKVRMIFARVSPYLKFDRTGMGSPQRSARPGRDAPAGMVATIRDGRFVEL
jgi:hypothetical protein